MKFSKTVLNILMGLVVLSFTFSTVAAQDVVPPAGEKESVNAVDPVPQSPAGIVYDKKPVFTFSRNFSATAYAIQVRKSGTDELLYSYKGVVPCDGSTCTLTPATKLPYYDYTLHKGIYKWRVRARVGGVWQTTWSDYMTYTSFSPGFTSSFDTIPNKWMILGGDWLLNTDRGFVKTLGKLEQFSSMAHRDLFNHTNGLVYEVIMKRKLAANDFNVAVVLGKMDPDEDNWEQGNSQFHFMYNNAGEVMLINLRYPDDPPLLNVSSPWVKPYDWNKLTVWMHETFASLWINEHYLATVNLDIPFGDVRGNVGVGMWKNVKEKSPLLVDWATVYYDEEPPYLVP